MGRKKIYPPNTALIQIRVSKEDRQKLKIWAAQLDITIQEFFKRLMSGGSLEPTNNAADSGVEKKATVSDKERD